MMRRRLTIDRAPGGFWNVVEVATGEVVAGPFRSRLEAEMVCSNLRVVHRTLLACA